MAAPPKPDRRLPKPRKPIKRNSKPIARRSQPAAVRRTSSGKAKHAADLAWSRAVRAKERICFHIHRQSEHFHVCQGQSEAAHIHSRRFGATRLDPKNGLHVCHWFHALMTKRPKTWEAFCRVAIGNSEYEELRQRAIAGPRYEVVLSESGEARTSP